jgi:lambda family phage portal protein
LLKRVAQFLGLAGTAKAAAPDRLQARFDAAQTNNDNRRHWENADGLAADAACDPGIRAILRNRGRYEQFNNPYMDGQLQTLAADLIGRGPKLRMLTDDEDANSYVEGEFAAWARSVGQAEKLAIAVEARAAAGEVFVRRVINPALPTPVKLDLMLIEADQVASPMMSLVGRHIDGIEEDRYGNPAFYWILRNHPGDTNVFQAGAEADKVPAGEVIHFFKPRRPGQRRGIPQITSALPLYAERRGFRKAVLSAARKIAELGAVSIESASASDSAPQPEPFEEIDLTAGMGTVMPAGWAAKQIKPEQPGTTYKEFDDKLINEAARPLSMPFNIAACNSSGYNYSSGRLDHQTYDRMLDVEHLSIELRILDRVFTWWLTEAALIPGYLPPAVVAAINTRPKFQWLWTGREHIDPVVEADAQAKRLANLTTTLTDELAREGVDLDTHLATLRAEKEQIARSGIGYQTTIDGPKVSSALEVLARVGRGEIAPAAGVELLIAIGIARTWAVAMVAGQPTVTAPAPTAPNPEGDPAGAVGASRLDRLGLNGAANGTTNGVHHG